jgi:hypothetical protein
MDYLIPAVTSVVGTTAIVVGKKSVEILPKPSVLTINIFPADWPIILYTGEVLSTVGFIFTAIAVTLAAKRWLQDKGERDE